MCTIPCERNPDKLAECKYQVFMSPFIVGNSEVDVIKEGIRKFQDGFYDIVHEAGKQWMDRLKGLKARRFTGRHPLTTVTQYQAAELFAALKGETGSATLSASASGVASSSQQGQPPPTYSSTHPVPLTQKEIDAHINGDGFPLGYRQTGGVQRFSDQKPMTAFEAMARILELSEVEMLLLRLMTFQQQDVRSWWGWVKVNMPRLAQDANVLELLLVSLLGLLGDDGED